MPGFDYAATLPQSASWAIEAICRSSSDTEIAFLFDEIADRFGIVGFHLVDGTVKRGRIISISEEYSEACDVAFEAFANGELLSEDESEIEPDSLTSDDDGILGEEP